MDKEIKDTNGTSQSVPDTPCPHAVPAGASPISAVSSDIVSPDAAEEQLNPHSDIWEDLRRKKR